MKKIISIILLQFSALIFAQAGSLDTTFDPGTGVVGEVRSTSIQKDGKIIIGGSFTSCNGVAINRIARLNSDGSLDTGFNPGTGANSFVNAIAIQPDGKIIIGGDFTAFNNTPINRIVRLNADGSIDTAFNPGYGANYEIKTMSLRADGTIIIGGAFTNYNGTSMRSIACLNPDGSLDASFNPSPNPYTGFAGVVYTTKIQSDGKIIVGGSFSLYSSKAANRVARLNPDGSLDSSFNVSILIHTLVFTVAIQSDGKIVIGGDFANQQYLCRLNADGSLDTGFKNNGAPNIVYVALVQPDGKIIIGGLFKSYAGIYRDDIARLNADGTLDVSFNPGTGAEAATNGAGILSMSLQTDGKIIIGGNFTTYNNTSRNGIARLNTDVLPPTASPQSFCYTATVANLVASGTNLKWYATIGGGSSLASTTVVNTGTYYVSQTINGGESGRIPVPVTVNAPVVPTFTQVDAICQGDVLQPLSIISNNNIAGTWLPALDNTKTTDYTFAQAATECATSAHMTITVNPIVTPAFTQISPICAGTALELSAISDNGFAGAWSPALDNTKTTTYTFTPSADCATVANMTIEVNPLPDLDADYTKIICSGSNEEVQLNAGLLSGSHSDYSYEWSKDWTLLSSEQGYNLTAKTDGAYTCVVKNNATGCQKKRTNTLVYSETIAIKDVLIADLTSHNTVTVVSSDPENSQYSLDKPTGPFQDSNIFENVAPGIHDVYVSDKNGCGVSKTITVVGAPPFFTPNGDGFNDIWKLQGIDDTYKNSNIEIFDRYGKLIKVLSNVQSDGWDGTYNGQAEPSDDYWFVINMQDGRVVKGHFALKR